MLAVINETGVIVLVAVVVMLFGTSQIPKIARNIAEGRKEFRKAQAELAEPAEPRSNPNP